MIYTKRIVVEDKDHIRIKEITFETSEPINEKAILKEYQKKFSDCRIDVE